MSKSKVCSSLHCLLSCSSISSTSSKTTSVFYVRLIVFEAKHRAHHPLASLIGLWDGFLSLSSLSLSLLSLLVCIDLQEPKCCLWAIPRVPSTLQGNAKWWVNHGRSRESPSLPGSHGTLAEQFSGVTSHCPMHLLGWSAILCHQSQGEITGTKEMPFCQLVTLSTPILWHAG